MGRKVKKSFWVTLVICVLFAMSVTSVQAAGKTGWVRKGSTYRYKVNGTYVKNQVKKIKKYNYYFDKKGIRRTGWVKYKKNRYYFDKKTARAYTGKKQINNKFYIFDRNGKLAKKKGLYKYGKTQVYIKKDGSLATGLVKIKGKWYMFDQAGTRVVKNGTYNWNGKTYYLKKGILVSGWMQVNGNKKHFNKSTFALDTGVIKIDSKYYNFDKNGNPRTGIWNINGSKYYFDKNGEQQTGFITIGQNEYYFGNDGRLVINRSFVVSKNTYCSDSMGCVRKNSWYDGKYFDNKGCMVKDAVQYNSETKGQITAAMLDGLPLAECTKLMVVAHPDDETLWGGAHLTEGGWFVVCLTNGYNQIRKNEFYSVMKKLDCTGLILSYPDLVNGKKSNWTTERYSIAKDIDTLLKYKHWGMVVTHNPEGEYGHIHHRMTNKLVTQNFYKNTWGTKLYYFGKWYSKNTLPNMKDSLKKVPEGALRKKEEALKLYTSQIGAVNANSHMNPYENWVRATDW